eukprot:TRINITY_DN6842_c0_g2_i2.p1 TRINITY_DN6842_c0_g2~~TRINITY_DN6842_c0_g2_i2.p1  ORF type:complete len:105 (-),score=12.66 TRINITY_DN6842_c0_g2_i2:749-1063(-)
MITVPSHGPLGSFAILGHSRYTRDWIYLTFSGQERFGSMTRVYFKDAYAAFVVFDVTRVSTFEAVKKWKYDIDSKVTIPGTDDPIPVILLANKVYGQFHTILDF